MATSFCFPDSGMLWWPGVTSSAPRRSTTPSTPWKSTTAAGSTPRASSPSSPLPKTMREKAKPPKCLWSSDWLSSHHQTHLVTAVTSHLKYIHLALGSWPKRTPTSKTQLARDCYVAALCNLGKMYICTCDSIKSLCHHATF